MSVTAKAVWAQQQQTHEGTHGFETLSEKTSQLAGYGGTDLLKCFCERLPDFRLLDLKVEVLEPLFHLLDQVGLAELVERILDVVAHLRTSSRAARTRSVGPGKNLRTK